MNAFAPGSLKGQWRPDVRYSEGDLVEYGRYIEVFDSNKTISSLTANMKGTEWIAPEVQETGSYPYWWVALPEPVMRPDIYTNQKRVSTNLNRPPINIQFVVSDGGTFQAEVGRGYYTDKSGKKVFVDACIFPRKEAEKLKASHPLSTVTVTNNYWTYNKHTYPEKGDRQENESGTWYWEKSFWKNLTEELTSYPNKYVRLQSVNPHMIDAFVLSKGIPDWYYYDLLGHYNSRLNIRTVVDLLRGIRGTVTGMQTYLNLINLQAEVVRLKPEEVYWKGNDLHTEDNRKDYRWFEGARDEYYASVYPPGNYWNLKTNFTKGIAWSEDNHKINKFQVGDYIFKEVYSSNSHTGRLDDDTFDKKYKGCQLWKAVDPIDGDKWGDLVKDSRVELIYEYEIVTTVKEYYKNHKYPTDSEGFWDDNTNPDNSFYRVDLGELLGDKELDRRGITSERDQQRYTCYVKRLMEFLIPAWIRFEAYLYLLDERNQRGLLHNATVSTVVRPPVKAVEPYTLTILPYVGFDPYDMWYQKWYQLNHTSAWDVEVTNIWGNTVGILWSDKWYSENDLKLFDGSIIANCWREDYPVLRRPGDRSVIKIRLLSGQKIKLRPYMPDERRWMDLEPIWWKDAEPVTWDEIRKKPIPESRFWRWSLLNFYHFLPHFRVTGRTEQVLWQDLEPLEWNALEDTEWRELEERVIPSSYLTCEV